MTTSIAFSETPAVPEERADPYELIRAARCPECGGPGRMVTSHRLTAIDHGSFCRFEPQASRNLAIHVRVAS